VTVEPAPESCAPAQESPLSRLRGEAALVVAGGQWTRDLPHTVQASLRWLWFDGAFALGIDSVVTTYFLLYIVALGATSAQVGLLAALSGLGAAFALLPGAVLVERIGRRKEIILASGGSVGRIAILLAAGLPFLAHGENAVILAIALSVLRDTSGNLSLPAWTSLVADIVPAQQRGRYFGSRTIGMTVTGMVTAFIAGLIINRVGGLPGYQWAFLFAFFFGAGSFFCFSRIVDPSPAPPARVARAGSSPILGSVLKHPVFLALCFHSAVWNFSFNLAAPFFNIYLVHNLQANAVQVGVLAAAGSVVGLPALRTIGPLADRWGPRRIVLITSLLIPVLPLAWVFVPSPWYVLGINLLSGALWAGFSLCLLNLLLQISPAEERARFTAVHQIVIALALSVGAATGGWVVTVAGYKAVFLLSAIGRFTAALIFAKWVKLEKTPIGAG
jgi:MFS family permease